MSNALLLCSRGFPLTTNLSRYCKVVNINPYHTLRKALADRINNFFHWLCNEYTVKKVSSVITYWRQLSQVYIKYKGRRISVHRT